MVRIDTLQGAHPNVVTERDASANNMCNSRIIVTSPNGNELQETQQTLTYEQRLDSVGTTMDLSPLAVQQILFSQPNTPPSDMKDIRFGAVTPPPERIQLNIKKDISPPKRVDIRYGAVTPPPGMAVRHNQKEIKNTSPFGRKKTMNNATKQKKEETPVSFALKEKYQKLLENSKKAEQQKKVPQKDGLKHRKMSYLTTI